MFKKILVPLDGSETAEKALPFAEHLARKFRGEMTLFTALEEGGRFEHPFRAYLKEKSEELGTEWVRSDMAVVQDSASNSILKFARENEMDQIVICTHGLSGPGMWSMGSIAAKVLQQSPIPVLLIRAAASDEMAANRTFRSILVPLDGSPLAECVMPYVEQLAQSFGSRVLPVQAVQPVRTPPVPVASYPAGVALEDHDDDLTETMKAKAGEYIDGREAALREKGIDAAAAVLMGKPYEAIAQYARSNPVGLIVLSTHGYVGNRKIPYGSITSKILEGSSQPVLVVRPQPVS
ncbi:MAG: universal stress protein [Dehalococcoidia bacterium]